MGTLTFVGGSIWKDKKFVENNVYKYEAHDAEDKTFELSEGDKLVPGLVDAHAHMWDITRPGSPWFCCAAHYLREGYLAFCDPGSLGPYNYGLVDRFRKHCESENLTVKTLMELFPDGLHKHPPDTPYVWQEIDLEAVKTAYAKVDRERCIGFKIHLGWSNIESDRFLLKAIAECRDTFPGSIAHVHLSGTFLKLDEIVSYLKPGDCITHILQGGRGHILDKDGKFPIDLIHEIENNGIYINQAHGLGHFSWKLFDAAYEHDWLPFSISTDGHLGNYGILDTASPSLSHNISRYINFGYDEDRVFRAVIDNPAEQIRYNLEPDKSVLLLKKCNRTTMYYDTDHEYRVGSFVYEPTVFCKNNELYYDFTELIPSKRQLHGYQIAILRR